MKKEGGGRKRDEARCREVAALTRTKVMSIFNGDLKTNGREKKTSHIKFSPPPHAVGLPCARQAASTGLAIWEMARTAVIRVISLRRRSTRMGMHSDSFSGRASPIEATIWPLGGGGGSKVYSSCMPVR